MAQLIDFLSWRANRRVWLLFALLLIGANSFFAFGALRNFGRATEGVDRTYQILIDLEALMAGITDAEAGQRSYLATGNGSYLGRYRTAVREVTETFARLRATVLVEQARLDALEPLIERRLELLHLAVERRRAEGGSFDAAILRDGDEMTERIRAAINELEQAERRLQRLRAGTALDQGTTAKLLLAAGTVLSLAIIGGVFALARREERIRKTAEDALRAANSELERRVEERTLILAAKEQFLATVIDNIHDAILVHRDDAVVFVNRAGLRLFGAASPDQVIGRSPLVFYPPELRAAAAARRGEVMTGSGQVPLSEQRLLRLDGRAVDVEAATVAFEDAGRRTALSIMRDITQRKAAEAQLRQAQKMEAVGQLTGGVAHDFNNLLTVIVANLDILADTLEDDAERRALVNAALGGAMRGAELTRRLLAFARQQPLEPQTIDLNQQLPELVATLRRTLGEQIRVEVKPAAGLWPTRADPSQVEDALLNLAINARDAMPEGGTLTVETGNAHLDATYAAQNAEVAPGDYVLLAVTDTGTGMRPEVIEHAMEPFFTTKEQGKGTGLGLSMIYGFAKQSGGHLKIYSEVGHGTTVKLYLPRATSVEPAAVVAAAAAPALPVGHESVLLVEDNNDVRAAAVRQLTDLGYRVRVAANGPAALAVLDSGETFDLLFTDIVMPERMTGYDLARLARERQPGLKLLFTTGYAKAPTVAGSEPVPDAMMLSKPYRKQELAEKVRAALDRPA